ncbi:MAG: asparagine synthase-related protein [Gallionellaceae bacterium]
MHHIDLRLPTSEAVTPGQVRQCQYFRQSDSASWRRQEWQYLLWVFRNTLKGHLPDATINKSPHGVGLPFGLWSRDCLPLCELIETALSDFKKTRLDAACLYRAQSHRAYDRARDLFRQDAWVILTLEEWLVSHQR